MQTGMTGSLVPRMIGAARLDANTYEAVEHDTNATTQAAIVVVLAAIAGGIGAIRTNGIGGLIFGIIIGIVSWAVFAAVAYFVGTRLLATPQTSATWGEVARTMGFSYTPQLLAVFGFIPILGPLLGFIGAVWAIVTAIIALRQALEMSTGRAIVTGIISAIIAAIIIAIPAAIFGVAYYGIGG